MLTKKFVKRSFTFKFYVKVWSCNNPFSYCSTTAKQWRERESTVRYLIAMIVERVS